MCTIGYCKDLNLIFKNRDKPGKTNEEIIVGDGMIACRTAGADYYSWGLNRYGCSFAGAAINSPRWTQLIYEGKRSEAKSLYNAENKGLRNPMPLISMMLSEVRNVDEWLDAVSRSCDRWIGYNLLIADRKKAYIVELHADRRHARELGDREVITNHFQVIDYGPRQASDYPSSFQRLKYGNDKIASVASVEDVAGMLNPDDPGDARIVWRSGEFSTVSSSIMNFQEGRVLYAGNADEEYARIALDKNVAVPASVVGDGVGAGHFEMSRYIDLELYHQVERQHPFYVEMIDEICGHIERLRASGGECRLLELGAGTGLFTERLLQFPFLRVTALEYDVACCDILDRHLGGNKRLEIVNGDAVTYCREGFFDIVASTFAHDHIHYDRAAPFAQNIRKNLCNGGAYLMGGEILPVYSTMEERAEALRKYHGFIVNKALRDGNFRVAQIEINALESGLGMVGDFKRHQAMFEREMAEGGMTLDCRKKIGPLERDDAGGVYVYVYRNGSAAKSSDVRA